MAKTNNASKGSNTARIRDEAVLKATGKTWDEWGRLLDKDGCKTMPHKDIADLVSRKHGVGPWWSQMVTVGYEQSRGLRKVHEVADGWVSNVSRTMSVPVATLFGAWADECLRTQWMGKKNLVIRKATRNKSLRITWPDESNVDVNFYAKGTGKSQVAVEHAKLKKETDVAKSKEFWTKAIDKLKTMLTA